MVGNSFGFAVKVSFWPTRSWSTFKSFFHKEAKGNVANVDVAVQPALQVLSIITKTSNPAPASSVNNKPLSVRCYRSLALHTALVVCMLCII